MSFSMWMWRIVVPGLGLGIAGAIIWQSWQGEQTRATASGRSVPARTRQRASASRTRVVAEGRVVARPDADIVLGAEESGAIERVLVHEKSMVRKGDLLVELRSADQAAALAEARAKLEAAEVEHSYRHRRMSRILKADATSTSYQAELDEAHRDLDHAIAERRAAIAAVKRCEAALARTRVKAPIDGTVVGRFVQPGETVSAGGRLVEIADLSRLRIEADVDEFDIARLALGAEAAISAEGFGERSWRGRVEEIPDRVEERETRPDDPGRPSDSRVLRVKVALESEVPFKLGQKVELELRTTASAGSVARKPRSSQAR